MTPILTGRARRLLLPAVLTALASPGGAAAQEVRLAWKFVPGEVLEYLHTTQSSTDTSMGAMTQTQEMRMRMEVLRVGPDGAADLRYTYVSMRGESDGPMGHQEYDSELDGGDDAASNPALAMVGLTFEATMGPDGGIRSMKGTEALLERMLADLESTSPEAAVAMRGMLEEMFSEERLTAQMQQGMATMPRSPIEPGAEWVAAIDVPLPFGTTRAEYTYRLQEVVSRAGRRVAVIGMTGSTGPMEMDPESPLAGMMAFSGSETTGTVEFDADRGILLGMRMTTVTEGESIGTPLRIEMSQRMELIEE